MTKGFNNDRRSVFIIEPLGRALYKEILTRICTCPRYGNNIKGKYTYTILYTWRSSYIVNTPPSPLKLEHVGLECPT